MTITIRPGITLGPGTTVKVPQGILYYFATNVITISGGAPIGNIPPLTGSVRVDEYTGQCLPGTLNVSCLADPFYNITNGSVLPIVNHVTPSYVNSPSDYTIWIANPYNVEWEIRLTFGLGNIINNSQQGGGTYGAGISVLGITPPAPPQLPLVTDGLVLHYDFSNPACYTTGASINDLSTINNNGTVVNDYGHISYVSDGDNSYFNWDSNAGGSGGNSFGGSIHTTSTNVYKDFTIVFEPDFTMSGMRGVFCAPFDKSLRVYSGAWTFPNGIGNSDDWDSTGSTTFYINGQVSNQAVAGWNIMGGGTTNPEFFTAKQLYIGTSGYENRNMQGKIAVVLMYNRVLTQEEHLVNYNHYKTRFGLT